MGRDSASGISAVVYGVVIEMPDRPRFDIMGKRLENFAKKGSRSSKASKAEPDKRSAKAAKLDIQSVLISDDDTSLMSDEEKKLNYFCSDSALDFDLEEKAAKAIAKILKGRTHGVKLAVYHARTGYERDDGAEEPIIMLQTKEASKLNASDPEAIYCEFELPNMGKKEKDGSAKAITQVLDALGLEAEDEIGWKFVLAVNCHPL